MTELRDALAAVRAARRARDDARSLLHALRLRRASDGDLAEQRRLVAGREADVRAALDGLLADRPPQRLIEAWDDGLPILLLPLRVETRWSVDASELWVRVYPDDVAITTHERLLTDAEVTHGRAYWTAYRAARTDDGRAAAWRALADRFGANRASWVALETRPTNWDLAASDASVALEFPDVPLTKPDAWTEAPHSRVLPDRFVLLAWRGETLRVNEVGRRLDDVVVVGPAPLETDDDDPSIARDPADGTLTLGTSYAWVRDFAQAIERGMAFRVPVAADDVAQGFDRLLVLGLKHSADEEDARALVEELIDGHRYAREGFEVLRQGTPTNNTDDGDSGFTGGDRADGDATVPGADPPRFVPTDDRAVATDGQRLADFLGIGYAPLLHAAGAERADHAEAVGMNRALYAGTLGYYVDQMLNEVIDEGSSGSLRRHFTDLVTGRGPIAAIRVGAQPYGVLPTSALPRWRPTATDGRDPFEPTLVRVLASFDAAWSTLVSDSAPGAAGLLDVLALHPTSAEFYQRVGYSYDYLQNLEGLAWGGASFSDVLRLMIEGSVTRTLLTQLGYAVQRADGTEKPLPLLLHLIWRHYQTRLDPLQLIDGQPLSERALVKPYDAATGATYLDWLFEHAADAAALEAQDFGTGVPRPGALLYLMLHFSLVMEAGRGAHRWLGDRGVIGDELVRSRKFLNIGPEASPSVWEVLRAPANRIVKTEASDRPLLEVLHAPQLAGDAGQGVREQRDAIAVLRALPTARLERALVEHVDTLSYRLDAWQTSLVARRLHRQRRLDAPVKERRTGVYLGAYGYLEHVRPVPGRRTPVPERTLPAQLRLGVENVSEAPGNGGYVHTPSLNHATAAALLRSGYLTHATPSEPDALAVNLTSERVRRARYLLEGVRNGQSLEVLLGIQFERGLHDWTTRTPGAVILDHLKPAFRAAFPILRTRVPQADDASGGAGAAEVKEDHQVTNGLTLASMDAAAAASFPDGVPGLPALDAAQRAALRTERDGVANTLDALRDVLTSEAAYQLALGNFDRAAAVLQSAGSGTVPPDVEVLATPRGTGIAFTQRLAVSLAAGAAPNPWPAIPLTERARLEPSLNAWLGDLLGAPDGIRCRVAALDADEQPVLETTITLADLGVQPIDVVYLVRSQAEPSGAAELEARVRDRFARDNSLGDDVVVRIAFADAGGDPAARSFAEVLPLADRLRRLLGTARPLDARHFQSASKDAPPPPDNPGRVDLAELRTRVGTRIAAVRALFPTLRAAASGTDVEAIRDALRAVADTGFSYALPLSATGVAAAELDLLARQADAVLARADALGPATDDQLAAAVAAPAAEAVALLADAVKAWMGADVLLLPRFAYHDPVALAQAEAARDELLAHVRDTVGVPLPLEEWLHGVACVRPLAHDFEMARAMADAARDEPLALSAIQLPFRAGDRWLGAEYPPTMEVVHDTVSIVRHLPPGFVVDASLPQCGLLLDEWTESVPTRAEVTGLAFNFDAPDSAPPQALLLAVSPDETGRWAWDDLVETVLDTFRRARLRAVEPDRLQDLGGIGTLLPAVMAEFSTSRGSVSLDYSFVLSDVRARALALMTSASTTPGG
ncbi:hypothetical protein J421_5190 (plasmid) [Gemmatirosa kalamazoonensis]|uniref:Uncharacterized protein n=1 Tax=Gemmatirosa kalamazoonensis TaxID=861299 RepID=W0RQZ9_9BACT|nr:hypothetical protein [Gemmatirosa kalamazoonensis]AHG92725.1 hypothetical protein J421_5190 [Gemmatirosa kalamazoonensis]